MTSSSSLSSEYPRLHAALKKICSDWGYEFREPFTNHIYEGYSERPTEDELKNIYLIYDTRLQQLSEEEFNLFVEEDYLFGPNASKMEFFDDLLEEINDFFNNYYEELE